jgi:hypothetical protein
MSFNKEEVVKWALPVLMACIKTDEEKWESPTEDVHTYLLELNNTIFDLCDYIDFNGIDKISQFNANEIITQVNEILAKEKTPENQKRLLQTLRLHESEETSNEIDAIMIILHSKVGGVLTCCSRDIELKMLEKWAKVTSQENHISLNIQKAAAISFTRLQDKGEVKPWEAKKTTKSKNEEWHYIIAWLTAITYAYKVKSPNNKQPYIKIKEMIDRITEAKFHDIDNLKTDPDWRNKVDKIWSHLGIDNLSRFREYFLENIPNYTGGNGIRQLIKKRMESDEVLIFNLASTIPQELLDND